MSATVYKQVKRPRWLLIGLGMMAVALLLLGLAGLRNARSMPIVRRATLPLPELAPHASPIRIALISDIHLGNAAMTPASLAKIVTQVNAEQADLVLLAGDFVAGHDGRGAAERAAQLALLLGRLKAPLGTVAVLGNHDHWTAPRAISAALRRAGIEVLENRAVRRGALAVVGIGDRFSGHDDIRRSLATAAPLGGVPVVLTHSPDLVPDLRTKPKLVLAGHTHCGQVVLPGVGPLLTRAPLAQWRRLYLPRYRCGIVRDGLRTTVVTAGVGAGTAGVRLGAMPDWWLLTLTHGAEVRAIPTVTRR